MPQKISLLLAGLLTGVMIGALIPAQAHHSNDLSKLAAKVRTLQAKTRLMSRDGGYRGAIVGYQVVSLCEDGSAAGWSQADVADVDLRWLESCIEMEGTRAEMRVLNKKLQLLLKR